MTQEATTSPMADHDATNATTASRKRTTARAEPPLPGTRAELLALHRETRKVRNAAAHGSREQAAAIALLGRIEVEVARIERAMDPPLV
jgi:hypothetical protein